MRITIRAQKVKEDSGREIDPMNKGGKRALLFLSSVLMMSTIISADTSAVSLTTYAAGL